MRVYVRAADKADHAWIAYRAHLVPDWGFRAIKAVDEHGRILGMVGYDGWTENSCCIHVALDHPSALRPLLRPGFGVPFKELRLGVVIAKVLSTNNRSLRLVEHLGFREMCRGKDWVRPGIDMIVSEMRRESCRWVEA